MTQVVIQFWTDDPSYSDRGRWGDWFLVSSIDGEDVYIPDLPDGYGESETLGGILAASTGVFILTTYEHFSNELGYETESTRMYHLDLESKKWTLLDLEGRPGEYIYYPDMVKNHTYNGQDYISFVLTSSEDDQNRIVDLDVASKTFSYIDVPSSAGGVEYTVLVNRHFIITEGGDVYSRDDMSTPLLIEDHWSKEYFNIYYDDRDQLNHLYKYYAEAGSDIGVYHKVNDNPHVMIIPEDDYSPTTNSRIRIETRALGYSTSGNVYVAPAYEFSYADDAKILIRFYGQSGNLSKEFTLRDLGVGLYTYFNGGTSVSDNGQYALFNFDLDWEQGLLLVDINGNYKDFSGSLRKHFQQDYEYGFHNPRFLPSQQENKPKLFWTLFKNTVEVY